MLKAIFRTGLILASLLIFTERVQGQVYDNQCPVGQFSIVPLRTVVTTTGHYNDTVCYDTNGNLIFQSLGASLSASDTFTRANGGLGSNWKTTIGSPTISSNAVTNTVDTSAIWANPSFVSTQQFAQVTIVTLAGTAFAGPTVLASNSAATFYACIESSTTLAIQKVTADARANLTTVGITGATGDIIRLEITSAGAMTCYRNGVSALTISDTTFKSGSPGFYMVPGAGNDTFNNWSGGNLPVSSGNGPTINGASTTCESNGVIYVGQGITCWSGADIAAQINTAYSALPASGGRIHVIAQNSCYVATTPIAFSTVAKPVLLEGDPGGASCISWATASSTIVAILLDWGTGEKQSAGVRDLQIIGPGLATASFGIELGNLSGSEAAVISGVRCGTSAGTADGFGTCIGDGLATSTFTVKVANSHLMNSGVGLGATQGSESLSVADTLIARNTTGVSNTAGTILSITGASSIDDNGTGIAVSNGGAVECYNCHFENLGVPAAAASYVVLTNSGGFIAFGGSMQDDQVLAGGPTAQFIQGNSGACYVGIFGTFFATPNGRTLTQIATLGGTCRANLQPRYLGNGGAGTVQTDFNQAYLGGPVFDCPMSGGVGVNNVCGFFGSALQFRNGSGLVSALGGNLYTLSITNPGAPRTWTIADQLMTLWGGINVTNYQTATNCAQNTASPAACGSAASGVFAVPTTTTTYTVNTTQVTANSRIFIQDITDNTGIPSSPTCTALAAFGDGQVTARVAATSFTISLPSTAGVTCFNYWIIN